MKLSIVSKNEDFLSFLESRTSGMQVLNRYTTLTDEHELAKFNNDFNHVDIFLFLDFQDLSKEFKEFLDYMHRGKSYFLNTEEILLIAHKDPKISPTPDLEKNLQAIEAYMEKLNLNLRVVRLDSLKFQDIYKSITASDSVRDNAPKQFIKYKVMHNSEGITIPPKKKEISIVPDTLKGQGSVHKMEDLQAAQSMENTVINVPSIVEPLRVDKDFKDDLAIAVMDTTIVFITGVRYSGKTTLALKCAKDFEEQNLTSAVLDLTSRKDMKLLNRQIKCDISMLKGLSNDMGTGKSVIGVEVYSKVYSSIFLTHLLKSLTASRTISFCEVDPEELPNIYKSFKGNKVALVVVPNTATMLRDSIKLCSKFDFNVVPVINNTFNSKEEIKKDNLKDSIPNSRAVFSIDNLSDLTNSLMR